MIATVEAKESSGEARDDNNFSDLVDSTTICIMRKITTKADGDYLFPVPYLP